MSFHIDLWARFAFVFVLAAFFSGGRVCAQGTPRRPDPLYVLILDHSCSMMIEERDAQGREMTRWDRLRQAVSDFVSRRDVGTRLKLIVFEPTAADPKPIKIEEEIRLDSVDARDA